MINFPYKTIRVSSCLAVWRNKSSRRKAAGLFLKRGTIQFEGKGWYLARLSYHLNIEPISRCPPNLKDGLILHTCDNGWCVNPKHLYKGTARQNQLDVYVRQPKIHGKEAARKISEANKRWWAQQSSEERTKFGLRASLAARKVNLGKIVSEETRQRQSTSQIKRHQRERKQREAQK